MKKKLYLVILVCAMAFSLVACGNKTDAQPQETAQETETVSETVEEQEDPVEETVEETETEKTAAQELAENTECPLEDGIYKAKFTTDSSMFHVNEANEDYGELTVANGKMTIHVTLAGKGILNLYPGLAEDAEKEGAVLLQPTTDEVTYSDGTTDEVYGYDIPVPYLDEEFDVALIGKKEVWYDHKVCVTDAELLIQE
ncbi:MAG: hypothetical protein MJ110_00155 [Lachnospiraceae bacterium]|nr:hypothetical protein [Lachnospiraceae bacterium]